MNEIDTQMLEQSSEIIQKLRDECPLTHCITNYVTINDCANAVLAIGGSPAMADTSPEIAEFVQIAGATIVNIGTLFDDQIKSMEIAAEETKKTNTPFVLDPVAVGVSQIRNEATKNIIDKSAVSIIRGNISEIKTVAKFYDVTEESTKSKGVDAADSDIITRDNIAKNVELAKNLAKKLNTVIDISGQLDIISDGENSYVIDNGDAMMPKITGSGCMLTCILGAFAAVANPLEAAIIGSLSLAIAGELAAKTTKDNNQGTGSFRAYLIDELSKMDKETIMKYGKLYKY
ncbi:MAG: hydroxyethylthiazole kinase [Methanosphaera stadtmanae]|nr:hydroxyethylthiazole kinase [Methanosphaera stadtmanae]